MGAALEVLVGPEAKGLSASTVSRLKQTWAQETALLDAQEHECAELPGEIVTAKGRAGAA